MTYKIIRIFPADKQDLKINNISLASFNLSVQFHALILMRERKRRQWSNYLVQKLSSCRKQENIFYLTGFFPHKLFSPKMVFLPPSALGKDHLYIMHHGEPPNTRFPFTTPSHRPRFPDNLWTSGELIYNMKNPADDLPPKRLKNDCVLRFNSRFESGNLNSAYYLGTDTYHLILEYDNNQSGSCQWFYFQITNTRRERNYTFYISGFHKNSGVYTSGSKIFMYSEHTAQKSNISWVRAGNNYGYGITNKETKPNGKVFSRCTLTFQLKFNYHNDTIYLCYALPYTYTDLLKNIEKWKERAPITFQSEMLCRTYGGRECPVITITNPKSPIREEKRKCVFITARVHPGESNGSYMAHGLIDFLLSNSIGARYILDHCIVKIVPMICIDGVVKGSYRVSENGFDLNRVWTNPDQVLHPVVAHTKRLISRIAVEREIAIYIDFHGHSRLHGTFAFGCPNDDNISNIGKEKVFPKMLSYLSDAFCWQHCTFSYPNDRKSASRIVVRKEIGVIQSFTIESSFGGMISGPLSGVLFDERIWKNFGSKTGEAIYHLINEANSNLKYQAEREVFTPQSSTSIDNKFSDFTFTRSTKRDSEIKIFPPKQAKISQPYVNRSKQQRSTLSPKTHMSIKQNQLHMRYAPHAIYT